MEEKHRAVVLVLANRSGEVLLQHRDDTAPISPGQWGLFGGGIEPGEEVRTALIREALEELNYDAINASFAFSRI